MLNMPRRGEIGRLEDLQWQFNGSFKSKHELIIAELVAAVYETTHVGLSYNFAFSHMTFIKKWMNIHICAASYGLRQKWTTNISIFFKSLQYQELLLYISPWLTRWVSGAADHGPSQTASVLGRWTVQQTTGHHKPPRWVSGAADHGPPHTASVSERCSRPRAITNRLGGWALQLTTGHHKRLGLSANLPNNWAYMTHNRSNKQKD
jgi:hypothetical protein